MISSKNLPIAGSPDGKEDSMGFITELLKSYLTYFGLVACAGIGVWAGISLRKRKNARKESVSEGSEEK